MPKRRGGSQYRKKKRKCPEYTDSDRTRTAESGVLRVLDEHHNRNVYLAAKDIYGRHHLCRYMPSAQNELQEKIRQAFHGSLVIWDSPRDVTLISGDQRKPIRAAGELVVSKFAKHVGGFRVHKELIDAFQGRVDGKSMAAGGKAISTIARDFVQTRRRNATKRNNAGKRERDEIEALEKLLAKENKRAQELEEELESLTLTNEEKDKKLKEFEDRLASLEAQLKNTQDQLSHEESINEDFRDMVRQTQDSIKTLRMKKQQLADENWQLFSKTRRNGSKQTKGRGKLFQAAAARKAISFA